MLAFALDKPEGLSSQQALSALKRKFKIKKLGHTGTLDPFATGVLPVFIEEATKLIAYLDDSQKTYVATLKLGERTDTQDKMGQVLEVKNIPELKKSQIEKVFEQFLGEQMQTPPQYSAIKVNGKAMYRYARAGEVVELKARKINVLSLKLISFNETQIEFETTVSRGTYIRSLGESIAVALETLGHLTALRRTVSGCFEIKEAYPLATILELDSLDFLEEKVDLKKILKGIFHYEIREEASIAKLRSGQRIPYEEFTQIPEPLGKKFCLYFESIPQCIAELVSDNQREYFLKPLRIFHAIQKNISKE